MGRVLALVYGGACYALFLVTFLYAIGFVGNLAVPKSIDSGERGPLATALLVDLGLLALFAFQHSVMARPSFKRRWTRLVPWAVERSTYVLVASLVLALLFWQWRPIPAPVWEVSHPLGRGLLWALFAAGWLGVVYSTRLVSHTHLFGLRQVWEHYRGLPHREPEFRTPSLYRVVRHPMMAGFLLAFWATPEMSAGHLLFAAGASGYILVALQLEERNLLEHLGEPYRRYRGRVPMLLPWPRGRSAPAPSEPLAHPRE